MNFIKKNIPLLLTTVIAAVLLAGAFTFLKPCGPKEDGSFMTCHYLGSMVKALSAVIFIQCAAALFNPLKVRNGLLISNLILSVLLFITPVHLIATCMMPQMTCNTATVPGVRLLSILLAVMSLICILTDSNLKKIKAAEP